jgi:hypothetical protein
VFYVQNLHDNATTRVATFVVRFGPGIGLFVGGMKWFAGTRHMVTKFFGALFFGTLVDTVDMQTVGCGSLKKPDPTGQG